MKPKYFKEVEFRGKRYLLIGNTDGPLATKDQYETGKVSFAYLCLGGIIVQNNQVIGYASELVFTGNEIEATPTPEAAKRVKNGQLLGENDPV